MLSQLKSPGSNDTRSTLNLPYGYQIDLDFIGYCENVANVDHTDAEMQRKNRRRQRQSMEVMLGIQLEMQQQMNDFGEIWEKKPPEPPPRSHLHTVESPIVPKLTSRVTQWDPALSDVVNDFERTLERSKRGKESSNRTERDAGVVRREVKPEKVLVREFNVAGKLKTDTCISSPQKAPSRAHSERPQQQQQHHISIESIDGSSSMPISPPERRSSLDKKRIRDLEEQVKLIPLLQMQIQSLKDERKQLILQVENSRAPSTTSSSSNTQAHFQVQRVSPVSLQSMKLPQNSIPKRTVGTNTHIVLHRDVGSSSEKTSTVNASTLTDFRLPCDGHDRLYSEKDLMKTVELVHSKMRKSMTSIGVQHDHVKVTRSVAVETKVESKSVSCNTSEPLLMAVSTGSVSIAPFEKEASPTPSLSLRDMSKPPVTRNSTTQTQQGSVHHQMTQVSPQATSKSTDSTDLIRTIHRAAGTEVVLKKDQNVHTDDLIKVHNTSTNTIAPKEVQKRTTACNTTAVDVKSVGVNCEEVILPLSTSGSASKIPRPSPSVQRKFVRQETFTVNNGGGDESAAALIEASKELRETLESSKTLDQPTSISQILKGPSTSAFAPVNPPETSQNRLQPLNLSDTESKSPSPSPSVAAILSKLKESPPRLHHTNISSIFGNTSREASPQKSLSPFAAHPSSFFEFRRTPERERTPVSECPVEIALQLTMNHRSPSPPPVALKTPETAPVDDEKEEKAPVEPSKMTMSPSIEYLDDDDDEEEDEYEDDEFNDEQLPSSMPMRPPPTSISTIRLVQEGRVRIKPSKEMISALKVINDHLEKYPEPIESQIRSARDVAASEWFRISSTEKANPDDVEDYLDNFEEFSWDLLTYIVNMIDNNGNMAMHYAVSHGNFDVVSILLDSKVCDINQTNNAGYTSIMLVSLAKLVVPEHRTVVQRLFKLADVNIRASKNSQTALMLAVSHGNFTMVQMLVEAGADINIQDDDGSTALMCAAEQGHLDIIKYLLAQPDCDSTKHDVDGNTALKISLEAGYHDIGCLLYAHEHLLRSKLGVKRTSSRKSSTSSLT